MAGDLAGGRAGRLAGELLERLGDPAVQARPPRGAEVLVQRVADQQVVEGEAAGRSRHRHDHGGALGAVEHVRDPLVVELGDAGEQPGVELAPDHRRRLQHGEGLGAEGCCARDDQLTQRRRRSQRGAPAAALERRRRGGDLVAAAEATDHLGHEQRVAVGLPVEGARVRPLALLELGAGQLLDQVEHVALAEPLQLELPHPFIPAQLRERGEQLGALGGLYRPARGYYQQAWAARDREQVVQEEDGRNVRPVEVVEQEHDGLARGGGRQQRSHRAEQHVALAAVPVLGCAGGGAPLADGRHQARQLPERGSGGLEHGGRRIRHQVAERFRERLVRRGEPLVGASVQHQRAAGVRRQPGLGGQPGLAYAGLSCHQDDAALAEADGVEVVKQQLQLAAPSHAGATPGGGEQSVGHGHLGVALPLELRRVPGAAREAVSPARQQLHGFAHKHVAPLGLAGEAHRFLHGGPLEGIRTPYHFAVRDPDARPPPSHGAPLGQGGRGQRPGEAAEHRQERAVHALDVALVAGHRCAKRRRRAIQSDAEHGRRGRQRCGAGPAIHGRVS